MHALKFLALLCVLVECSLAEERTVCVERSSLLGGLERVKERVCFTPNCPAPTKGRKRSVVLPPKNNLCVNFSDGSQEIFEVVTHINDYVCYKRNSDPTLFAVQMSFCNKNPTV